MGKKCPAAGDSRDLLGARQPVEGYWPQREREGGRKEIAGGSVTRSPSSASLLGPSVVELKPPGGKSDQCYGSNCPR